MRDSYVTVRVTPRARTEGVVVEGDTVEVRVRAAPEKGAANAAILALLAEALGVGTSTLRVVAGATGRRKLVAVEGMDTTEVLQHLRRSGGAKKGPSA